MPRLSTHLTKAEEEIAKRAARKLGNGETLTVREGNVWKKAERLHRDRQMADLASGVSLDVLSQWTGRSVAQLKRAAQMFGLSCGDSSVALSQLLRECFELIAQNAGAITGEQDDEALAFADSSTPSLERLRMARAKHAELDLAERRRELVRVADVVPLLDSVSDAIHRALATLARDKGQDAADDVHDVVSVALDDAVARLTAPPESAD